jgi:hypothetical protein
MISFQEKGSVRCVEQGSLRKPRKGKVGGGSAKGGGPGGSRKLFGQAAAAGKSRRSRASDFLGFPNPLDYSNAPLPGAGDAAKRAHASDRTRCTRSTDFFNTAACLPACPLAWSRSPSTSGPCFGGIRPMIPH